MQKGTIMFPATLLASNWKIAVVVLLVVLTILRSRVRFADEVFDPQAGEGTVGNVAMPKSILPPETSGDALLGIPDIGTAITRINTTNPFLYAYLSHDQDSYQVAHQFIRALEPGLSVLWIRDPVRRCCQAGGAVIDVGSHFGYYALLGHSLGCKVVAAFEPVPLFRGVLSFNFDINGLDRSKIYPYAVGSTSSTVKMVVPTSGVLGIAHVAGVNLPDSASDTVTVEQRRLDQVIDLNAIGTDVCMMKVDVEGYEPEVLLSSRDFFKTKKIKTIMIEFSPGYRLEGTHEMLAMLHEEGYEAYEVPWAYAKLNHAMTLIDDPILHEHNKVDLSTTESRRAFVEKVLPFTNTNLWIRLRG